jgi:drug/metabolite transporter (DMT)-like permease
MELEKKGKIELILAMVLSGTIGLFVLESGQPSLNVVFFRCLFGSISLLLFCWYKGYLDFSQLNKKTLFFILAGGVAIVLNWVLLFESYNHASISISTVVYHTQPMFVVLFATIFMGEKLFNHKLLWVGLAFLGVVLIVNPSGNVDVQTDFLYGIGLALAAAILYAIATLIIKQLSGIKPHFIAAIQVTLGTLLLAPFVSWNVIPSDQSAWNWLIGLGVIHTCIMYILLYSSFQKVSTNSIAVLSYIYPVVAILVDYLVYDQSLSIVQVIGMVMIIAAGLGNNMNVNILNAFRNNLPKKN